jgi:hypothetical protein
MPIPVAEVVNMFKEQKCVFLFGPGLAKNRNNDTFHSCITRYFKEKQLEIEEDLDDLYSCEAQTKTRAYLYLKEYCRVHGEPTDQHQELALIPCHLYLSITPDLLMKRALDDCGVDHEFKYYVKDQKQEEVVEPTAERPLLYNLFGSIENQQSLIFTHGDLIQYLFSIIREQKLPNNLRDALDKSLYFIFLGFDFEKWYLKLLLRLIFDKAKLSIATEEGEGLNEQLRTFYQRNYGLEFVDKNIEEYIRTLYDECANQGLLRTIKEKAQPSIRKEVKKMIKQGEVKQALERFIEFLEDEHVMNDEAGDKQEFIHDLYSLSGRFARNERRMRKSTITEDEARAEEGKIREALLDIAQSF